MTQTGTGPSVRTIGAIGIVADALIIASPMADSAVGTAGWIVGIVLLLPFLTGLAALAGDAGGSRWLVHVTAAAAGSAVALQLATMAAAHAAGTVPTDSVVHEPLHAVEGALFGLTLLPLGIALAAVAAVVVRQRSVPRWLGYATIPVALALIGNGAVLGTEQMPGLMLLMLWILVASMTLTLRRPAPREVAVAATATAS
jgi:hypothetical protein